MAVPGFTDGWFSSDSEPLRPHDLPSKPELERLWADSEQDVFLSAFDPGADLPRTQPEPRSREFAQSVELELAESIWK